MSSFNMKVVGFIEIDILSSTHVASLTGRFAREEVTPATIERLIADLQSFQWDVSELPVDDVDAIQPDPPHHASSELPLPADLNQLHTELADEWNELVQSM